MRITVDLDRELLVRARKLAAARGEPLRAMLESALRKLLDEECAPTHRQFRLRDKSVPGRGLQEGLVEGDWQAMRQRVYDRRGG